MMPVTKEISCQDTGMDCDFVVRSEDENEVIEFVQQHARDAHDMEMDRSDAREMMKKS